MHFFYRIWDCDTCIRDVKLVAEVYTSLDAIIEWIGIFQGLIFQRNFLQFYLVVSKVLGKVWPGFKNKYDLDIYDLR